LLNVANQFIDQIIGATTEYPRDQRSQQVISQAGCRLKLVVMMVTKVNQWNQSQVRRQSFVRADIGFGNQKITHVLNGVSDHLPLLNDLILCFTVTELCNLVPCPLVQHGKTALKNIVTIKTKTALIQILQQRFNLTICFIPTGRLQREKQI